MKEFVMNQEMNYIIYGAGGDGIRMMQALKVNGLKVSAIIDRRAKTMEPIENIPVICLEKIGNFDPQKSIIIITLKNVFEHTAIATLMLKQGFSNLLYKPLPCLNGSDDLEWNRINYAYDELLLKQKVEEKAIPCSRIDYLIDYSEKLIINRLKDEIVCFMPSEMIFNYNTEDSYGRIPMAAFYPMVNFYRYLFGFENSYTWEMVREQYIIYCSEWANRVGVKCTEELKNSWVDSREGIFNEMQRLAEIDSTFFIRNAVKVELEGCNRFFLRESGRNRIAFLIAKGSQYIPVKMSLETYRRWMNEEATEKIKAYISEKNMTKVYTKIGHPVFASFQTKMFDYPRMFGMPVVMNIILELHKAAETMKNGFKTIQYEKYASQKDRLKIVCDVEDMGSMGRYLTQSGLKCYQRPVKDKELVGLLDNLYSISVENGLEREKECLEPDIYITETCEEKYLTAAKVYSLVWEECPSVYETMKKHGYAVKKVLFHSVWDKKKVEAIEWEK